MSAKSQVASGAAPLRVDPWIYRPWLDLLVGCGAWSAPLLAFAALVNPSHPHEWNVSFYLLAVIFNYPHFMATVYRAYRTRDDFEKYKFFTLNLTLLLAITAVLLHTFPSLLPWVFTLYICWSPWHYTGQNYGLLLMFVRRGGKTLTNAERRFLRAAFVASYLMLLASFETGGSSDPLILSLGLPAKFTIPARIFLGATFLIFGFLALQRPARQGLRTMAAPLTLFSTQFLWFVLPTLLELRADYHIPQTRYSSGILAVLHSAQYLWITSYYQGREARAKGEPGWRMAAYFVALIAGGIALFIPGPWLVSYALHFDFTTSFLIFTALVNIHHFLLDGAIWKLRDSRIASLLIDRNSKAASTATAGTHNPNITVPSKRDWNLPITAMRSIRIALIAVLFLWGAFDQIHFALGTYEDNLPALQRAARLNPYDSMTQARIASAELKKGQRGAALQALGFALNANPRDLALQEQYAREILQEGRYEDAYEHYRKMLAIFPRDTDALINFGILAERLGHPDEAIIAWQRALAVDPNQPRSELYLANALDKQGKYTLAIPHWQNFLNFAEAHPNDPAAAIAQRVSATVQLADDEFRAQQNPASVATYAVAIDMADKYGDSKMESIALAHAADAQEKSGNIQAAAKSRQRGLSIDEKVNDFSAQAIDWFNYGQFLRRHAISNELAYACLVRAENLLERGGGQGLATVRAVREQVGANLGARAAAAEKELPALLAKATDLPQDSF